MSDSNIMTIILIHLFQSNRKIPSNLFQPNGIYLDSNRIERNEEGSECAVRRTNAASWVFRIQVPVKWFAVFTFRSLYIRQADTRILETNNPLKIQ